MTNKQISLGDFLTDDEIKRCVALYKVWSFTKMFVDQVERQIITPNLPRINKKLGQENNSRFLAYAVQYVLSARGG